MQQTGKLTALTNKRCFKTDQYENISVLEKVPDMGKAQPDVVMGRTGRDAVTCCK